MRRVAPSASSPAMLMYTSGTTGTPKGALLSHGNLVHAGQAVSAAHELAPSDRVLSSLPLYHVNGQCIGTISPLVSGGSIVMPHRFSLSQWWPLVERYRPTWLNAVPTIVAYLLNGPDHARAGVPRGTLRALGVRAAAAGTSSRLRSAIRDLGARRMGSLGAHGRVREPARSAARRSAHGTTLGLRRASWCRAARRCRPANAARSGTRGNVMLRYHKDPEATARTRFVGAGSRPVTSAIATPTVLLRHRCLKEVIIRAARTSRRADRQTLLASAVLEARRSASDREYGQEFSSAWC
jgi:long-chain acyl-CoA synthetase